MKLNRPIVGLLVGILTITLPALLTGCAGTARTPKKAGFLSSYHHLEKVDETTSRSITPSRLALYKKFQITAANCLVTEYDGKPLPAEAQRKVAEYLRESVAKALADRYPIVSSPGAEVGEIRVAITQAYKTGNQLGLTVEGEIMDSYSAYQAAAVMRTELGKAYVGDWWDGPSAKEIIDAWAGRLRQAIDGVQSR
jgi:hypothetical protein